MSYEIDAWTALKTACDNTTALTTYFKTIVYGRRPFIFMPAQHPVLMAWADRIPEDSYITFPKRKQVKLHVIFTAILRENNPETLQNNLLTCDALLKNVFENDITLDGKAIITNIDGTDFGGLTEDTGLLQIPISITLPHLTAGNR